MKKLCFSIIICVAVCLSLSSCSLVQKLGEKYFSSYIGDVDSGEISDVVNGEEDELSEFNGYYISLSDETDSAIADNALCIPARCPVFDEIPEYNGEVASVINGGEVLFSYDEITDISYTYYGNSDGEGKCSYAVACISASGLADEVFCDLSYTSPSGYKKGLEKCELIPYMLTSQYGGDENSITCSKSLIDGIVKYSRRINWYVGENENHVMVRVTPAFYGDESICRGVLFEAYSVEDCGYGINFCVFIHNIVDDYGGHDYSDNDEITEAVRDYDTEKQTEKSTERVTEKQTEKSTKRVTEKQTEKSTERTTEKQTEKSTERSTERQTEKNTERVTEKQTERQTERVTEKETEKETEPITEKETESETERETEFITEKETEPETEKETEAVTEKETEPETEKETEPITEPVTEKETEIETETEEDKAQDLIVNTSSKKFHTPSCSYAKNMSEKNKKCVHCTCQELIDDGYAACKKCNPTDG